MKSLIDEILNAYFEKRLKEEKLKIRDYLITTIYTLKWTKNLVMNV